MHYRAESAKASCRDAEAGHVLRPRENHRRGAPKSARLKLSDCRGGGTERHEHKMLASPCSNGERVVQTSDTHVDIQFDAPRLESSFKPCRHVPTG